MNILQINNLNIFYKKLFKKINIINNFNLEINEGEIIALIGKTGCGKTSIARTIMGIHKDYEGSIIYNINKDDIQYIFQDPYLSLNPFMNISYSLCEGLKFNNKEEQDLEVISVLNQVGLDINKRFCYPSDFSGGERQKIAIARALIHKPKLIIADEITSSIDYYSKSNLITLFKKLQKENNFACLFISHDLETIAKLTDKIVSLD